MHVFNGELWYLYFFYGNSEPDARKIGLFFEKKKQNCDWSRMP